MKSQVPGSFKARRAKDWTTLTSGELLVWIGITFRMGTLGRARAGHYWCGVNGLHDDTINDAMLKNRYNAIASNLSFAPRGTASGWAKISWLDDILRKACRAAIGITQHITIDESMIKCLSKFCPWIQYMPKKPIKRGIAYTHIIDMMFVLIPISLTHSQHTGIKVFCLVLSTGFLYDWHLYRGQDDPLAGPQYVSSNF